MRSLRGGSKGLRAKKAIVTKAMELTRRAQGCGNCLDSVPPRFCLLFFNGKIKTYVCLLHLPSLWTSQLNFSKDLIQFYFSQENSLWIVPRNCYFSLGGKILFLVTFFHYFKGNMREDRIINPHIPIS